MARLKDRVAIVTGAAQGIGRGIAKAMTKEGALVALWDIKESVHQTARDIADADRKVLSAELDISDSGQVEDAVRQVIKEYGRIDILVNNAGIARFAPFLEMTNRIRDEIIR